MNWKKLTIYIIEALERRSSVFFDIRTLNREKVNNGSISYKKLQLVETVKTYLVERRKAFLPPDLWKSGYPAYF